MVVITLAFQDEFDGSHREIEKAGFGDADFLSIEVDGGGGRLARDLDLATDDLGGEGVGTVFRSPAPVTSVATSIAGSFFGLGCLSDRFPCGIGLFCGIGFGTLGRLLGLFPGRGIRGFTGVRFRRFSGFFPAGCRPGCRRVRFLGWAVSFRNSPGLGRFFFSGTGGRFLRTLSVFEARGSGPRGSFSLPPWSGFTSMGVRRPAPLMPPDRYCPKAGSRAARRTSVVLPQPPTPESGDTEDAKHGDRSEERRKDASLRFRRLPRHRADRLERPDEGSGRIVALARVGRTGPADHRVEGPPFVAIHARGNLEVGRQFGEVEAIFPVCISYSTMARE